jgi:adenine-specific DNA-methyltransferase
MDEVFGDYNHRAIITIKKTSGLSKGMLPRTLDFVLWYSKTESFKYKQLFLSKVDRAQSDAHYATDKEGRVFRLSDLTGPFNNVASCLFAFPFEGRVFRHSLGRQWKTTRSGVARLAAANRVVPSSKILNYRRFLADFPLSMVDDAWTDFSGSIQSRSDPKIYVVQTSTSVVARCIAMTTEPGDLVLDPTCGSGTTAYVAEQWGRRWITIDTSRVALALARARIMGARFAFYLLSDSPEGHRKEAEVNGRPYVERPAYGNVRHGFVCERVPHVTLQSIATDSEIDVIAEQWQPRVEKGLAKLNLALRGHDIPLRITNGGRDGKELRFDAPSGATQTLLSGDVVPAFELLEWEVPHEAPADWPEEAKSALADFWRVRIARQEEVDASIAAKAESEFLHDQPYEDRRKVRVAGPLTVESVSPHRTLAVGPDDELIDAIVVRETGVSYGRSFEQMILENLKAAGVQQAHKADRIAFSSLVPWPGELVCGEGRYQEGASISLGAGDPAATLGAGEKRAAIFIGPEFGTVGRADLVKAAREAGDAGFDVLIACAFNYEAHAAEFDKLGRIRVLKARMNADLHMAGDLKATSTANLFVIFGEPDIDILHDDDGRIRVHVKGVDVFDPSTGEVRSDGPAGIACWFIDTDYNEESFFVRHAYFLGQNDPYSALRTTLKAEINADAWETLHSEVSRPFDKPASGRIAVKVINHLGDEVMKVFRVE